MNKVDIGSDDFLTGSTFVKLGNVAYAIGKVLLANGSPNKFQAERDAWPFIHTGIVAGKLHPLAPETLNVLSINDYGNGVVGFDELVEWGLWCKRFEFVKQPELSAQDEYVPLSILLADYWDEPLSELPEELRARVSLQKEKRLVGHRPKYGASGELECDAEGHYPVWEEVYAEHETGGWIVDWDALTSEQRQMMASQKDDRHDPALKNVRQVGLILGYYSIKEEWPHWAGKPTLVADEAIPLMNGLDPKSWRNRDERRQPLPDDMVNAITRGLQIAEADVAKAKSPTEWLAWGRSHGLDKPTMKSDQRLREPDICMWPLFADAAAEVERRAQEEIERKANEEAEQAAQEEAQQNDYFVKYGADPSAEIYPVWQKRLTEISKEMKSESMLSRYPTKDKACKKLAEELVEKDPGWQGMNAKEKAEALEKKFANVKRRTRKWD